MKRLLILLVILIGFLIACSNESTKSPQMKKEDIKKAERRKYIKKMYNRKREYSGYFKYSTYSTWGGSSDIAIKLLKNGKAKITCESDSAGGFGGKSVVTTKKGYLSKSNADDFFSELLRTYIFLEKWDDTGRYSTKDGSSWSVSYLYKGKKDKFGGFRRGGYSYSKIFFKYCRKMIKNGKSTK